MKKNRFCSVYKTAEKPAAIITKVTSCEPHATSLQHSLGTFVTINE
jgi:hypothetical protein